MLADIHFIAWSTLIGWLECLGQSSYFSAFISKLSKADDISLDLSAKLKVL
jgi:hypothetical protein